MYLDDTEYDEAENWMEQCTCECTEFMITVNDYEKKEPPPPPLAPRSMTLLKIFLI
jgi:hypothetical protein